MIWRIAHRFDPRCAAIADRHYSRQKIGSPQFVKPGACLVLLAETPLGRALWVTSWQDPDLVKHAWPGAWECALFRNEGAGRASDLIRSAVAATRYIMGRVPELGMVTFVKTSAIRPKRDPGHCFIIAGFRPAGETRKRKHLALRLDPGRMPEPDVPLEAQIEMVA